MLFLIMTTISVYADKEAHSHGSKSHSHPLPPQGVSHKHGNTEVGRYNNQNKIKASPDSDVKSKKINFKKYDDLYAKEMRNATEKFKDGEYDPTDELRFYGSGEEFKEIGLWYLKNAKNYFDFEKAAWYLLIADSKISLTDEEELHLAKVASIAALPYMDPKNSIYDPLRAFKLHREAARLGLQSSYISAAFIQRLSFGKYARKWGYHPADFITNEAMLFRKATNCSKDNLERKLYPWTKKLCNQAQKEMRISERRVQKAYSSSNLTHGEIIAGFAVLAVIIGAFSSDSPNTDYTWKQPPINLGELLLWLK